MYLDTLLNAHQSHISMQTARLDQMERIVRRVTEDMADLREELSGGNQTKMNQIANNSVFLNPILRLVTHPAQEKLCVGPGAVISKVQAIRRILTNDKDPDLSGNSNNQVKYKAIKSSENDVPSKQAEDVFIDCYLRFSRNRYHFIEKGDFMAIVNKPGPTRSHWEWFVFYICLANGCRIAELTNLAVLPSPKYYFDKAVATLVLIPELTQRQQIRAIMLLALYLHYNYDYMGSFVMNVWELSAMAIRKMIQLGYHHKKPVLESKCMDYELEKRLFWSVYAFDRLLSLSLGRDSSISDHDFDVPFPLSLESIEPELQSLIYVHQLNQQGESVSNPPIQPLTPTSLTYLVETCKIRQIEGKINTLVYENVENDNSELLESLGNDLEKWLTEIPSRNQFSEGIRHEVSFDYFPLLYHRAKLFILLPQITHILLTNDKKFLHETLSAAGGICRSFKKIHRDSLFGYSTFSLHTIFLAGVTLVYCVWALGNPASIKSHNDIRACSNLLYSFSERMREAETYRILFENLVENILYNVDVEELAPIGVLDDEKLFNFAFDDDFWKRLS